MHPVISILRPSSSCHAGVAATAATHHLACRRPALTPSTSVACRGAVATFESASSCQRHRPGPSAGLGHERPGRTARLGPRHVGNSLLYNNLRLAAPVSVDLPQSIFKGTLRDIGVGVPKASVWRRRNAASRLSLLCEASLAVQGPWMAAACRAGMKEPAEKTSWSCAELLKFAP